MTSIDVWSPQYPERLLLRLGAAAPDVLHLRGDPRLLSRPLTAWFASGRIPSDLVLPALEHAVSARERGLVIASGFHSPVERECLDLLLAGDQPVVLCPAREVGRFRMPRRWGAAVERARLLILSHHGPEVRRPTARSAEARNRVVAALADNVFVIGASRGGRLHALSREVVARGQELSCFDHPANEDLLLMGATPVRTDPRR